MKKHQNVLFFYKQFIDQHTYHSKKNFQSKGKFRRGKSDSGYEP